MLDIYSNRLWGLRQIHRTGDEVRKVQFCDINRRLNETDLGVFSHNEIIKH